MYEESYGSGMTTSNGSKEKMIKGSRDLYATDMYDMMPAAPSGMKDMEAGITSGMKSEVTAPIQSEEGRGKKSYEKGKGKPKAKFTSFDTLREYSKTMG